MEDIQKRGNEEETVAQNPLFIHPILRVIKELDCCDKRRIAVEFECDSCCKKALNAKILKIIDEFLVLTAFDDDGILVKVISGGILVEKEIVKVIIIPLDKVCSIEIDAVQVSPPPDGPPAVGPLSTGPFFIRAGQNNAINVKVQNASENPITVDVKLFDIEDCPVTTPIQTKTLTIPGGCCARDAILTAPAGNFEVVICPTPNNAPIRAFVSVHSGAAVTSAFEYVIKAAEMLAPACKFC